MHLSQLCSRSWSRRFATPFVSSSASVRSKRSTSLMPSSRGSIIRLRAHAPCPLICALGSCWRPTSPRRLHRSTQARAHAARQLAEEIRATVTMIARNPVAGLTSRPTSRRVLEALVALGGEADFAQVRTRSGHSPTHFSNILKRLAAHGLVRLVHAASDRRAKRLVLSEAGRATMPAAHPRARHTANAYPLELTVAPAQTDDAYSPAAMAEFDPA